MYFVVIDNHLLETNIKLLNDNNKLEHDVQHLRLANAGLEKASEARFADEISIVD